MDTRPDHDLVGTDHIHLEGPQQRQEWVADAELQGKMAHLEARWVAVYIRSNLVSPTPNRQDRGKNKGRQTIQKYSPNSPGTSLKEEKIVLSLWKSQLQEFLIHPCEIQGRNDCSKSTNRRGFFRSNSYWRGTSHGYGLQLLDWIRKRGREHQPSFQLFPPSSGSQICPQNQAWGNQESQSFPVCNLLPQPMSGSDSYSKSHSWLLTRANDFLSE